MLLNFHIIGLHKVAPPLGAWIEIFADVIQVIHPLVAPPLGAWIEIDADIRTLMAAVVAPPLGAWIEIRKDFCRTMC